MATAKKRKKYQTIIIGCGNIAWHLAARLMETGRFEVCVANHRPNKALREFASKLKCTVADTLSEIPEGADFYFICVPDNAIGSTALHLRVTNPRAVVMHCAGSMPVEVLGTRVHHAGVFYPLQTFTRGEKVNWSEIPVVLESRDTIAMARMQLLASAFTTRVITLSYAERLSLHTAAVLTANFPNALYHAATELLAKADNKKLEFNLLLPLIRQTTAKLEKLSPAEAQTGPARRGDTVTLRRHRALLADDKLLRKIYKQMSKLIERMHEK